LLYSAQTACAKTLVDSGRLGRIYHVRSSGYRRRDRPFVDGYGEKEFVSQHWAGHGALFDMGVYHISQLLYLLNTPKALRISGAFYQELEMDESRRVESGYDVEELCVGMVMFENGLSMSIQECWAIHGSQFPNSSLHGSKGGLQFSDTFTGKHVTYFRIADGYPADAPIDVTGEQFRQKNLDPSYTHYSNSQNHWIGVLRGECEPIDTAHIGLQTMLISEGLYLSGELNREILTDEIPSLSKSNAVSRQDTPFGELKYLPHPFY